MKHLFQLLFIVSFSLSWINTNAQIQGLVAERTYYNNLNADYLLINPASAGAFRYLDARVFSENNTNSITPQLFVVNSSIDFKDGKFGVGGRFGYSEESNVSNSEYSAYLARHLELSENSALSFGVSPSLLHRDGDGIQTLGNQEVIFPINDYLPNLGIGTMFSYSDFLQIGIAVPNVFTHTYWSNDDNDLIQQTRKGYLTANFVQSLTLSQVLIAMSQLRIEHTKLFNKNNPNYKETPSIISLDIGLRVYAAINFGVTIHHNPDNSNNRKIDYWATYFFRNGINIGSSFQIPSDKVSNQTLFRLVLGYSFSYKESLILSPIYLF